MQILSIINQTTIDCATGAAIGAAYGAAYGALINPVVGVGAGAVFGAVAKSAHFLLGKAISRPTMSLESLGRTRPDTWVQRIAFIPKMVALGGGVFATIIVQNYAGLYAGKYALAALGFKATIAPSLSLVVKFHQVLLPCTLGASMAIVSANFLWNRTFSIMPRMVIFFWTHMYPQIRLD